MSRMNNSSRSLRIISLANGWDPNEIQDFGSIEEFYHVRSEPYVSDTNPIPAIMNDPTQACPDTTVSTKPTFVTPELRENQNHRKENSDPFPGMPGAK